MYYQGVGALGALANGKVFTPSMRKDAIGYNAGKKGQLGWKANISGAALADAVFTLQAYLFSNPVEADGKLGPKTNGRIKSFAKNNKANMSVPFQAAIQAVTSGQAPTMMNDNVAASILQANGIEAGVGASRPTPPGPRPTPGGPKPPITRVTQRGAKKDDNTMMYLAIAAALGIGTYLYMKKK